MAIVRRKDKRTGGVTWLSITTALLELEIEKYEGIEHAENKWRKGYILDTDQAAYELIE